MDRRGKVPLEIEKVIKRQEVTETDMERGRFFGDIAEMRLTREKNYASIIPSLTVKFIKTPLKALFYLGFSAVSFRFTI